MTSTSTYTSEKVLPYVYMGKHRSSEKMYIGVRYASNNTRKNLPSNIDLYKYRTSSKVVKPIFEQFDWTIIAEFFDVEAACEFENELINEYWPSGNLLNKSRRKSGSIIFRTDYKNRSVEKEHEHKQNLSKSTKKFWASATPMFKENHSKSISITSSLMWKNRTEEDKKRIIEKANKWREDTTKVAKVAKMAQTRSSFPCIIDGIFYENRKLAAAVLNHNIHDLRKRLNSDEFPNYIDKSTKKKIDNFSITIDGLLYNSIREAARNLKISRLIIKSRLESENFPNYLYKLKPQ